MKASLHILRILLAGLFVISMVSCSETTNDGGAGADDVTEADDMVVEADDGATVVDIPDVFLRKAIASELKIQDAFSITVDDMLKLTSLYRSEDIIANLTGLEHATNLDTLELPANQIVDISPLKALTNLETLNLFDNPLSQESLEIHIPAIEANGTVVFGD